MDSPNGHRDGHTQPAQSASRPGQPLSSSQPTSSNLKTKQKIQNSLLALSGYLCDGTWLRARELPRVVINPPVGPVPLNTMPPLPPMRDTTLDFPFTFPATTEQDSLFTFHATMDRDPLFTFPATMDIDPLSDDALFNGGSQFAHPPNPWPPNEDELMMNNDNGQLNYPLPGALQNGGQSMSLPPSHAPLNMPSPQNMHLPLSMLSPRIMPLPQTMQSNTGQSMPTPSQFTLSSMLGVFPDVSPPAYPDLPDFSDQSAAVPHPDMVMGHSHEGTQRGTMPNCCWIELRGLVDECAKEAGMSRRDLFMGPPATDPHLQDRFQDTHVQHVRQIAREAVHATTREFKCKLEGVYRRLFSES